MPEHNPEVARALGNVIRSAGFVRNERLSLLLRFLVERHLNGLDHELKESVLGTEVFGRKPGYDPKRDPIVRTEARRLRKRLSEYYEGAGASDAVRIDLPKGGYVPRISAIEEQLAIPIVRWTWPTISAAGACVILLAIALWAHFWPKASPRPNASSPAYDLYLRARAFEMLPNVSGVMSSIDLFKQAIAKDPSFAPAYAGIAAGYAAQSGFDRLHSAQVADMFAQGWAAAAKAIQLEPQSADAYDGLAMMQARQAQWKLAERSFRRAIGLSTGDPLWRDHFVMFLLLPLGRVEEAIQQLRIAEELDPLLPQTHTLLGQALRSAGRFDEAFAHCQKGADNDRTRSGCWADSLVHQGKSHEAVQILESVWAEHLMEPGAHALGIAYAKADRRKDAERMAAMLPRLASKAQIFAALGDKDRTLELLNQMVLMGPTRLGRDFLISPNLAFLQGDPRLDALRTKVGLPQ